jgi:hypothetical protein
MDADYKWWIDGGGRKSDLFQDIAGICWKNLGKPQQNSVRTKAPSSEELGCATVST